MRTLVTDIGELVTNDPARPGLLGTVADAAFLIDDGRVAWVGSSADRNLGDQSNPDLGPADQIVSARGAAVIPGFVDSHNHLLFAGERSAEFAARMAGESYSAGGIATTVAATRAASDAELEANLRALLAQALHSGTTTVEIKSGYGLTVADELRALRIAARYTSEATLMAAHVLPPEYRDDPDAYVDLVIEEMIPAVAAQGLARWVDVFCEEGAFTEAQTERIVTAAGTAGLLARIHANQLTAGGALRLAARLRCASADHATFASAEDLRALAAAGTVATLLPAIEFSTRQPYPDARRYYAAGVDVAIASDTNPGSGFSNSIPFSIALAVRDMRFTVEQAIHAATAGGAKALRRTDVGGIFPGQRADFSILDAPGYRYLAYRPGVAQIARVYRGGEQVAENPAPYYFDRTADRRDRTDHAPQNHEETR